MSARCFCRWDSSGRDTGVGFHALLEYLPEPGIKTASLISPAKREMCLIAQLCLTLCYPIDCSLPRSSVHGDSPGQNNGVGCRFILQGIFPTHRSNPHLLRCRQILYHWATGEAQCLPWLTLKNTLLPGFCDLAKNGCECSCSPPDFMLLNFPIPFSPSPKLQWEFQDCQIHAKAIVLQTRCTSTTLCFNLLGQGV